MIIGKVSKDYDSFARNIATPEQLLSLLIDLKHGAGVEMVDMTFKDVLVGNLSLFADLKNDKEGAKIQEKVMIKLAFDKFDNGVYNEIFHKQFLNSISDFVTNLCFRNNKLLTDADLLSLFNRMKNNLEKLEIIGCERITGIVVSKTFFNTITTQWLEWIVDNNKEIKEIILKDCKELSFNDMKMIFSNVWREKQSNLQIQIECPTSWYENDMCSVFAIDFPDKGFLISSLKDGLNDLKEKEVKTLKRHSNFVTCLVVLHDGRLCSGSYDKSIKIWDVSKGDEKEVKILNGHSDFVNCLVVLPDGRLCSGSDDKSIKIWNVTKGEEKEMKTLNGHTGYVFSLVILKDGKLYSGSGDKSIKIWNVFNGEEREMKTLAGHTSSVFCLVLLSDGRLCSGSIDATIKIWDVQNGEEKEIITLKGHESTIYSLVVLNDGRLCSSSSDKSIKIWDVTKGHEKEVKTLNGHSNHIYSLIVLPNGRLCSGSLDNSIKIWDVTKGEEKEIKTLNGHSDWVKTLVLLPDGRLFSGSADKSIKIWPIFESTAPSPQIIKQHQTKKSISLYNAKVLLSRNHFHLHHIPLLFTKDLTQLDVSDTPIKDHILLAILDYCPNLVEVNIKNCIWLTDVSISKIKKIIK
jgi:WD40 repeat protein